MDEHVDNRDVFGLIMPRMLGHEPPMMLLDASSLAERRSSDGNKIHLIEKTNDYLSCVVITKDNRRIHYEMWVSNPGGVANNIVVLPEYEYTEREVTIEQAENLIGERR